MENPRPTRAEITDVANAIYDGTSAIMLSGETAAGAWPVEAVHTMSAIAERTERDINYDRRLLMRSMESHLSVADAIAHAACTTAKDIKANAIVTVTKSGETARLLSKYRPHTDIISCVLTPQVYRQLALSWGCLLYTSLEEGGAVSPTMAVISVISAMAGAMNAHTSSIAIKTAHTLRPRFFFTGFIMLPSPL